jgi:hypothetical protein
MADVREDRIILRMIFKKITERESVEWIQKSQGRMLRRTVVNMVMNIQIIKCRKFILIHVYNVP